MNLVPGLVASAVVAAGILTVAAAPVPADIQHDVVCTVTIYDPYKVTSTAVRTDGAVRCNYAPDIANTTVSVQIHENGSYRDYGTAYTTSSTGVYLNPYDSAPLKAGCWTYRGRITREAFHGTWGTTTKYSGGRYLCR